MTRDTTVEETCRCGGSTKATGDRVTTQAHLQVWRRGHVKCKTTTTTPVPTPVPAGEERAPATGSFHAVGFVNPYMDRENR